MKSLLTFSACFTGCRTLQPTHPEAGNLGGYPISDPEPIYLGDYPIRITYTVPPLEKDRTTPT
ncbi:MAG: hypothetical protein WC342_08315 [Methanoregula sp.]|jgi:hypothetical protein